jgi:cysteine desulfurase
VAQLIGSAPDEIIFTGGGTEANNLAICGVGPKTAQGLRFVTSTIEHPATARPLEHLERGGATVIRVAVDGLGQVDAGQVIAAANDTTALISIMHSNNETGALQPIGAIVGGSEALVHTDAAQSVGKVHIDVDDLGVHLLSIAGHKLYAPKGVGALYVRTGVVLRPLVRGAEHELGLRPGTENVASIVGLGCAARLARQQLDVSGSRQTELTEALWSQLASAIPQLKRNGPRTARLPNTLNISFPAIAGSAVLSHCQDLAASTGSACDDAGEHPSTVLLAMGLDPIRALGAVRISIGRHTSAEHIQRAANSLVRGYRKAREAA